MPPGPTLRQRFDIQASDWCELAAQFYQALLGSRIEGRPVDLDPFAVDNSDTQKKLVGRTYAGVDGYCPLAVYLGRLRCCLELALCPGVQHSARESEYNLERALPLAASLVTGPLSVACRFGLLLCQADAGNLRPGRGLWARNGFSIIKWNPRKTPVETVAAARAGDAGTAWQTLRPGKRECAWHEALELAGVGGASNPARRVYRLIERTIDKHGNALLLPEYVLEGWTTTLPGRFSPAEFLAVPCLAK